MDMKYAYYPGCSSESTATDQHASSIAVMNALGIELVEPEGWSCCGATAAHQTDRTLAASLAAANLTLVKEMGLPVMVNCAACFNRLKKANDEVVRHPHMRTKVADALGQDYDGSVAVTHFVEVLLKDLGVRRLSQALSHDLNGLKVACYYGCLLVRPQEVTRFDDPENPQTLDRLIGVMGGESLDWPHKVECCGGSLALTRTEVVLKLADAVLQSAKDAGADCIVVACPMCQVNLDLRQADIYKTMNRRYDMPIIYISQLLGLCLGLTEKALMLEKLMIPPEKILKRLKKAA